jgi:hypothetical protein
MPNDIYQLTVSVDVPRAGVIQNVMHYKSPDDSAANSYEAANDIVTSWVTANQSLYLACLADDCLLVAVSARRIYPVGGPTAVTVSNLTGAHADSIADSAIAANCQLIVDTAPFKGGHLYFGGIPFSSIVSNAIDIGFRTLLTLFMNSQVLPLIGTLPGLPSYQFGIWNRKDHVLQEVVAHQVANKPTALNKRMGPYI